MYNKTIKKSIVIIIISTLLFCCFFVNASTYTNLELLPSIYVSYNSEQVSSYTGIEVDDTNPNIRNIRYETLFNPFLYINVSTPSNVNNGFLNGYGFVQFVISFSNAGTKRSATMREVNTIFNEYYFSTVQCITSNNSITLNYWFNFANYYIDSTNPACAIPLPDCLLEFIFQEAGSITTLTTTVTASRIEGRTALNFSDSPIMGGMKQILYEAITAGLNSNYYNTGSVYSLLNEIANYTLGTSDKATIANQYLTYIYSKLSSYEPYFDDIETYLYQILHNGENDTGAANQLSQAAGAMESAANAMNVSKPNIAAIIPETLLAADAAQAQGEIFSWLNNGYITTILIACFTIALIGFVLYGKSG